MIAEQLPTEQHCAVQCHWRPIAMGNMNLQLPQLLLLLLLLLPGQE
jgi:hypothetical protein